MTPSPLPFQHPVRVPDQSQPAHWVHDEQAAWHRLYHDVGAICTATAIVDHFTSDAPARTSHLALYLQAEVTLARHEARIARSQRAVATVRRAWRAPWELMKRALVACRSLAFAAAAPATDEPVMQHIAILAADPRFVEARRRSDQPADLEFPPLDGTVAGEGSLPARAA